MSNASVLISDVIPISDWEDSPVFLNFGKITEDFGDFTIDDHKIKIQGTITSISIAPKALLRLEKSTDLNTWQTVVITSDMLDAQGRIVIKSAAPSEFYRMNIAIE